MSQMKGILHKTETGWVVVWKELLKAPYPFYNKSIGSQEKQLPLHPSDKIIFPDDQEGREVEFKDDIYRDGYEIYFDTEHQERRTRAKYTKFAKLIFPKQQETTWDDILEEFDNRSKYHGALRFWLKQNYHPPLKKK